MEHLRDIKQSNNIAFFIADGLEKVLEIFATRNETDQMSKVF